MLRSEDGAPVAMWLAEPMPRDVRQAVERVARAEDVQRIAVMPDVHLAEVVCVGMVVATERLVYPQAVGSDIGCGMAAAAFDIEASALGSRTTGERVLAEINKRVPLMRHRSLSTSPELGGMLESGSLSHPSLDAAARREGRIELGTLGRGNHFVELQRDADDRLWVMVHSGSRIMGQVISRFHRDRARRIAAGLVALDTSDDPGKAFLRDMNWAVHYAASSRRLMVHAVADALHDVLGTALDVATYIDVSHNHARREMHGGRELIIHRKGASPAAAAEKGLIPGSMGTPSYHVSGRGCEEALCSSSHGAGRVMSRKEAARRISARDLSRQTDGVIIDAAMMEGMAEEAPAAYKDIRAVMRAQRELVKIERELRPVLNYKGT